MLRNYVKYNKREVLAVSFFVVILSIYLSSHPKGISTYVLTIWANQAAILALAAMAQFFAVIIRGLDLSVGSVMALSSALASHVVNGSTAEVAIGLFVVLLVALVCGFVNGLVIVFGRIQPIVATLASSTIFTGVALLLRPSPGGDIDGTLADMFTYDILGIPTALIVIVSLLAVFGFPMRRSGIGLSMYAIGSNEGGAEQSGVSIRLTKLVAYSLSGLFAGFAGLYVGFVTFSGDAGIGPSYTLLSIAAVVLGGVVLRGGSGSLVGAVIGAFILKTISALMFFSGVPPLAQPFIEGMILALAIAIGGADIFKIRNRLEIYSR